MPHNLVFLFQVENGLHGKSENIEYLWHYAMHFLHSFTMCLENIGLLNENYWDDIDVIDQGQSKENVTSYKICCSISAIILPLFTEVL